MNQETEDVIDRLYKKVATLLHSHSDSQKIQVACNELRIAQKEEADRITTLLEAQLDMAVDVGKNILETVDNLISLYEDTT